MSFAGLERIAEEFGRPSCKLQAALSLFNNLCRHSITIVDADEQRPRQSDTGVPSVLSSVYRGRNAIR